MRSITLAILFLVAASVQAAPQETKPPREVIVNGVEFIFIPEGWFWYPVQNGQEKPVPTPGNNFYREVKIWLDGYYIAKFEARARDFKRFMDSKEVLHRDEYKPGETGGCAVRRNEDGAYYLTQPERDLPVTHLSWNLADEFTRWMGFRIPSEAEWVKAARGTDRRIWPWGNEYPDDTFAGFRSDHTCSPVPVDAFSNGKSPYGIYNMAGNAYEYVADWYNEQFDMRLKDGDRNPKLAATGTLHPDNDTPVKILKGGRWGSPASGLNVMYRLRQRPQDDFRCFGVRFAVNVATVREHLAKGTATVVAP